MTRAMNRLAVFLLALSAHAQTPAPQSATPATTPPPVATAGSLPSDPAALLQLASQVNGLHGADLQPWHVRATWQLTEAGMPPEQGTWEEWWGGEKKWKISFTADGFQQTRYMSDQGGSFTGDIDWLRLPFLTIGDFVQMGLPSSSDLARDELSRTSLDVGTVPLQCATRSAPSRGAGSDRLAYATEYCFTADSPALRLATGRNMRVALNSLVQFQGRYLARKVQLRDEGEEIDINFGDFETAQATDPNFTVPADAKPMPKVLAVAISGGVAHGLRISGKDPHYPEDARMALLQGTVVIRANILADGRTADLKIVSGHPMLQKAALDAVRTWRYRPYMLNGEPVEVETQLNIVFAIGR